MLICLLVHGIHIFLKLFVTDKTTLHLKALYCPNETHQQNKYDLGNISKYTELLLATANEQFMRP